MNENFDSLWYLLLIGILWGCTNPLMKYGSKEIGRKKGKNFVQTFWLDIRYLSTNWKYLIPLLLNQLGSVVFFLTLQKGKLSYCVPLANSLSLICTAVTSWLLGEQKLNRRIILGLVLTIIGIAFYVSPSHNINQNGIEA